jgi:hypothetical protein
MAAPTIRDVLRRLAPSWARRHYHVARRWLEGYVYGLKVRRLVDDLTPEWPKAMIRLGREADGGYLVPDDLSGIVACFSPGVDVIAAFELDLQRRQTPRLMARPPGSTLLPSRNASSVTGRMILATRPCNHG